MNRGAFSPIASAILAFLATGAGAQEAAAPASSSPGVALPTINVIATTPLSGSGVDVDKVPSAVTTINSRDIAEQKSANVVNALNAQTPSVDVQSVSGNPFQPDVYFRGFDASPVAGTPQGLAVYQNGVRINEAFGDVVNWDLIPTVAIRSMDVVSNNPVFGLNALGGAISIKMKDGFGYQGVSIDVMGGSYGRAQTSLQWGKQVGNWATYIAVEGVTDNGFREQSGSTIRRIYGDIGYKGEAAELHLNVGGAEQWIRRHRGRAVRTAAAELEQHIHMAAGVDEPGRLRQCDRRRKPVADVEPTGQRLSARLLSTNRRRQRHQRRALLFEFSAALLPQRQRSQLAGQWAQWSAARQSFLEHGDARRDRPHHYPDDEHGNERSGDQHRQALRPEQPLRRRRELRLWRHQFRRQRRARADPAQLRRRRLRRLPRPLRRSRRRRPGFAEGDECLYRSLRHRYARRHRSARPHGGRTAQCRRDPPAGSAWHGAQRPRRVHPFQPDARRDVQDRRRCNGLRQLFRVQSRADAARARVRRPRAPLRPRELPRFRPAVETGRCADL